MPGWHANLPKAQTLVRCVRHREVDALAKCGRCHQLWCTFCVKHREEHGVRWLGCDCGGRCDPVEPPRAVENLRTFEHDLFAAVRYPFSGEGRWLLLVGTVFYGMLDLWFGSGARMIGRTLAEAGSSTGGSTLTGVGYLDLVGGAMSFVVVLTAFAYQLTWLMRVIRESARGRNELPGFPDFESIIDSVLVPIGQGSALLAVTIGPGLLLLPFGSIGMVAGTLAIGAGASVLPMALLSVAVAGSLEGLDLPRILRSIPRLGLAYAFVGALFVATIGLLVSGSVLLENVPMVGAFLRAFLILHLSAVAGRVLGLVYARHQRELGWY